MSPSVLSAVCHGTQAFGPGGRARNGQSQTGRKAPVAAATDVAANRSLCTYTVYALGWLFHQN